MIKGSTQRKHDGPRSVMVGVVFIILAEFLCQTLLSKSLEDLFGKPVTWAIYLGVGLGVGKFYNKKS